MKSDFVRYLLNKPQLTEVELAETEDEKGPLPEITNRCDVFMPRIEFLSIPLSRVCLEPASL